MANEFKLPDVGEGLTEAEIVAWRVKTGDVIAINDIVVEIETAKSIVELPSPYAGEVLALLVAEGDTVEVGTPIIRIGVPGAAPEPPTETPAAPPAETPVAPAVSTGGPVIIDTNVPPEGNATLVGYGPKQRALKRRTRKGEPAPAPAPAAAPVAEATVTRPVRALAKPLVRRLARDLGVDLTALVPTGPKGTVSKEDVLAATATPTATATATAAATPVAADPAGRETREPIKGVRKNMAAAMVSSAFTAPHVTEWVTIDATATVELVARLKERREFAGVKVSPLLVIARACLLALRRTPLLNSTWDEAAQEVVVKHYVNLGIAAATPRGLVVPNVKDAHALSLLELAQALETLTATAREGRTQPADLSGGSFTITNVGVFGVDGGTPIINPGESAILCLGAIKPQPWVVGDQVVPRQVMTLSLSFDHRHIDGATGSQFLADVAGLVGDPATALLF
ncbi:2-oxo acid dehydrogenase subunit E2 [Pimelobacter simplex]|uniref:Dihydrolipoamide acetyltransferase component of pyruvate dehydrogenase complex n=1 Tax=Nocardioides simplex TaxID=2045 RepID=A0A0A1DUM9_NOCSI|nr:dihydrolipoamide acetyltransferase family protein [Pimelobacter simplex]AIY19115.1 Dihydrolipoamide acetyltransferase component of pyruvate dehydrogenase complex [Pimelobacter simplex]MCG8149133.1 2-oxo acid dehydrogenase subunit E2 [Pimelobacter simplex]GEB14935.1 dihydrolipoamide acetyltransferase component of pyruvate dehydrogenase complex [Pimelobacter simplex]SFM23148.1 pyruvate dehydrogenase E2 component (dihydrolipoamide acetyltransferase) [Pimelobacter simplex]